MRQLFWKDIFITLIPLILLIVGFILLYGLIFGLPIPAAWRRSNTNEVRFMLSEDKFAYAGDFRFQFQITIDGERHASNVLVRRHVDTFHPQFDPFFDELVFVHSEEEAIGFPDNVIVAWPDTGIFTEGLIYNIHWAVSRTPDDEWTGFPRRDVLALEEFGLSYPLTVADLVDNWEKVRALWRTFPGSEQQTILSRARGYEAHIAERALREAEAAATDY